MMLHEPQGLPLKRTMLEVAGEFFDINPASSCTLV